MVDDKIYTRKELEDKLTEKERIFCHEYIVDWNKSRAARVAGYSENTARQQGYDTYTKPYIRQYIEFIKDDIAAEAGISKLLMINELKNLATANLPTILKKLKENEPLTDLEERAIQEIHEDKKELGEGGALISKTVKVKLADKRAVWSDISKAMGWNEAEKIDHTTNGESIKDNVDLSRLTTEELKVYYAIQSKLE